MASPTRALLALALVAAAGCTVKKTEQPPLSGPSELSLSLTLAANPDTITQDGSSQSQVVIRARDANSQPVRSLPVRVDIAVDGAVQDFGRLSAKNVVTGSDGTATVVYTAPQPVDNVDRQTLVSIVATPAGNDATAQTARSITIRLVPPGIIVPPDTNVPDFTITPDTPNEMDQVTFDASDEILDARISVYEWSFGDGSTTTGRIVTHQYREAGSYVVTLTVTDRTGTKGSRPKTVQVGQAPLPSAAFTFSPTEPGIGEDVFFNASTSTAGEGRRLVSYTWAMGDGSNRSGMVVSKSYDTAGTYTVTLTVKDDIGNTASTSNEVTVGTSSPGGLTAAFTISPSDPAPHTPVNFNASTSTSADRITDYAWDFGDGTRTHGSSVTASHAYIIEGTFTVTLTVTDSGGRTARTTKTVTVKIPES